MRYLATTLEPDGSKATNVIEAQDEQALHEKLHRDGRLLLRLQESDADESVTQDSSVSLSGRQLLLLTHSLHDALDAGVPLLMSFDAVAEQEQDERIAGMLNDIAQRVVSGQQLADAMSAYPRAFPSVYVALVRAGEQSGGLPNILQSISGYLEWKLEIRGVVKQALVYPMIVGFAGYAMVLFLLSFVIPRLAVVLQKMGGDLPPASRVLLNVSGFCHANIGVIIAVSVALIIGLVVAMRWQKIQELANCLFSVLPGASQIVEVFSAAQFSRTFSVLLNAGLPMTKALELAGDAVSLPGFRNKVARTSEQIMAGSRLGEALDRSELLAPIAVSMVKVGEESGRLPSTFDRLSRLYDREVRESVKRALALLEPVVTILLGLIVGGVAVMVVMTIYTAMRGIGK